MSIRGPVIAALLLASSVGVHAAVQVGKATYVRGVTAAQDDDGTARIVGTGAPIYEGDVLRTASRSFAVLRLDDDSKVTLRPDTVFKVEEFKFRAEEESSAPSLLMRLFRGGLRTITGLVGKRNPRGFRLTSPVATIGIRGTDFEARLCGEDCNAESRRNVGATSRPSPVVARVAFQRGKLEAQGLDGNPRALAVGSSLFEGDVVQTADRSLAVVVFKDRSRATLRANSALKVERFGYSPREPEGGSVIMRFLRGSMRMVTGLVARARPSAFSLGTPVATIGIRGTEFELRCHDSCSAAGNAALEPDGWRTAGMDVLDLLIPSAQAQQGTGMSAWVVTGAIELQLPGGVFVINQNQAAFFDGVNPPRMYPQVPLFFQGLEVPDNDPGVGSDEKLFEETAQEDLDGALLVRVVEGDVEVTNASTGESLVAGPNEILFSNPADNRVLRISGDAIRLAITPDPGLFDEGVGVPAEGTGFSDAPFQCVVQ